MVRTPACHAGGREFKSRPVRHFLTQHIEVTKLKSDMDINWYYTEGELTLKVDGDEHRFSLEDLIAGSSVSKERRKKVQTIFLFSLLLIGLLQFFGGGMPSGQSAYFYIGYFATPLIFAGIISFLSYLYFRYSKKKITKLESTVKDYLSS